MGRRTRTSFKPGQSGNPRGRPPGVREALPRGLLRRLVLAAIEGQELAVVDMIRRCLKKPGPFLKMLELAGKFNKEIGADAEAQAPGFTLVFESPLRPDDLRQSIQNRDQQPREAKREAHGRSAPPEGGMAESTDAERWGSV